MRPRMEACRFQLTSRITKGSPGIVADRKTAAVDEPIDVEHPEPDTLHMECADRLAQRHAFVEACVAGGTLWLCLHISDN